MFTKLIEKENSEKNLNLTSKEIYELANKYYHEGNHIKSLELFHKSAEKGFIKAQVELGTYYDVKHNDFETAQYYYNLAANQGDFKSKLWLALSLNNIANKKYSPKKSFEKLNELIKENEKEGYYYIANYLYNGIGVKKDIKEAEKLMTKSALLGNENAQFQLGIYLIEGNYGYKNINSAIDWLEVAASNKHIGAIAQIGFMLLNGFGVHKNEDIGVKALVLASQNGSLEAQNLLKSFGFDYTKIEEINDLKIEIKKLKN